jgi:hypothetical protein
LNTIQAQPADNFDKEMAARAGSGKKHVFKSRNAPGILEVEENWDKEPEMEEIARAGQTSGPSDMEERVRPEASCSSSDSDRRHSLRGVRLRRVVGQRRRP